MIMPKREISSCLDMSGSMADKSFLYNTYCEHGYVEHACGCETDCTTITYDGFECDIYKHNPITTTHFRDQSHSNPVISVDFSRPIVAGKSRAIRISFEIPQALDTMFPNTFSFKASYFDAHALVVPKAELDFELEIPVYKMYDEAAKKGGFDIFLYIRDKLEARDFNPHSITTTGNMPNGTHSETKFPKFMWRARLFGEVASHRILKCGETAMKLFGLLHTPLPIDDIERMKGDIVRIERGGRIGLNVGVAAIIIAVLTWLIPIDRIIGWCAPHKDKSQENARQAPKDDITPEKKENMTVNERKS